MLKPDINSTEVHLQASLTLRFLKGLPDAPLDCETLSDLPVLPVFDGAGRPGLACCQGRQACAAVLLVPLRPPEFTILDITGRWWKPNGVKAVVGGLNALTGLPAEPERGWEDGEYLVVGETGTFAGTRRPDGSLRPLAPGQDGSSLEIVLAVAEPKPGLFPDKPPRSRGPAIVDRNTWGAITLLSIHLVDPRAFRRLAGFEPPTEVGDGLHRDVVPGLQEPFGDTAALLPSGGRPHSVRRRRRPADRSAPAPDPAVRGCGR